MSSDLSTLYDQMGIHHKPDLGSGGAKKISSLQQPREPKCALFTGHSSNLFWPKKKKRINPHPS